MPAGSVMERKTPQQIEEAVRAVLCYIRLCLRHDGIFGGVWDRRWSRTTLYMTQDWPMEDRYIVWIKAMQYDEGSAQREDRFDVIARANTIGELQERVFNYGNDGGLSALE